MPFRFRGSLLGVLLTMGCAGEGVPVPRVSTNVEPGPGVTATHPPPAALPEIVPEAPSETARWLDGYWIFRGDNWVWIRGGWIEVPPGVFLVPSRFWIEEGGVLAFCERRWVDDQGRTVKEPEIVEPAATPPTPTLPENLTLP